MYLSTRFDLITMAYSVSFANGASLNEDEKKIINKAVSLIEKYEIVIRNKYLHLIDVSMLYDFLDEIELFNKESGMEIEVSMYGRESRKTTNVLIGLTGFINRYKSNCNEFRFFTSGYIPEEEHTKTPQIYIDVKNVTN